jgi:glutathione peroxidase
MTFYDLSAKKPNGEPLAMADFKDKTILIVNTATQCGLTPQFEGLEALHQTYKDEGLIVLGFPCNQFASQEPLSNENMEETCKINHGVTFPLTEKVEVNGKNTHPVFKYLKKELGGLLGDSIKWNFTKFLIDKNGKPVKRYAPTTTPKEIEKDIESLIKA